MTSCCDVTNSVCPVTKTTIRHCSTLAFVRGEYHEAVAPGITRTLHATGRGAIEICLSEKGALAKKRLGNIGVNGPNACEIAFFMVTKAYVVNLGLGLLHCILDQLLASAIVCH